MKEISLNNNQSLQTYETFADAMKAHSGQKVTKIDFDLTQASKLPLYKTKEGGPSYHLVSKVQMSFENTQEQATVIYYWVSTKETKNLAERVVNLGGNGSPGKAAESLVAFLGAVQKAAQTGDIALVEAVEKEKGIALKKGKVTVKPQQGPALKDYVKMSKDSLEGDSLSLKERAKSFRVMPTTTSYLKELATVNHQPAPKSVEEEPAIVTEETPAQPEEIAEGLPAEPAATSPSFYEQTGKVVLAALTSPAGISIVAIVATALSFYAKTQIEDLF